MPLNRLFDQIERARETAHWQSVFGEPQAAGDRTLIPVARVSYTFGLGFGQGSGAAGMEDLTPEGAAGPSAGGEGGPPPRGEGGGVGGGASARPLGAIVITPDKVYFEETVDATKIAVAGIALAALVASQLFTTLRAIFGRG